MFDLILEGWRRVLRFFTGEEVMVSEFLGDIFY